MKKISKVKPKAPELVDLKKIVAEQDALIFQLKNIINNLPADVYWKDKNGVYSGVNITGVESLRKMGFIIDVNDVVGKTDYDLYPQQTADTFRKNDIEVMQAKKSITNEEVALLPSGEEIIQLSTKRPLCDANGNVAGILGSTIDITYLKKIEANLHAAKIAAEVASQAKSNFLATMSHELRTPLNSILGLAQVLLTQNCTREKQQEYIQTIERSGKNLLTFINDLLDFSRLEAGKLELHLDPCSLKKLFNEITAMMQHVIQNNAIELKFDFDNKIPDNLFLDPLRLQQVILNLLGNAIKFTLQGSVCISTRLLTQENNVVKIGIIVEDTGIGIPEDKLDTIFDRFTQVESQYDRRFEGSGLGLAIVKNLVEMMLGTIRVESELNKGSKFICEIPFTVANQNQVESDSNAANALSSTDKSLKFDTYILIVEDNPINQMVMQAMLANLGCKVDVANNGEEAIKLFKKNEYDLIFMDIGLPDMDGLQVTKSLLQIEKKLQRKSIPIIALTAHVMEDDRNNCLNAGMTDMLTKPIVYAQLVELLKKSAKPTDQNE
jgi:two-component system aerobic respiration control sensor histidine kinase ArcB